MKNKFCYICVVGCIMSLFVLLNVDLNLQSRKGGSRQSIEKIDNVNQASHKVSEIASATGKELQSAISLSWDKKETVETLQPDTTNSEAILIDLQKQEAEIEHILRQEDAIAKLNSSSTQDSVRQFYLQKIESLALVRSEMIKLRLASIEGELAKAEQMKVEIK